MALEKTKRIASKTLDFIIPQVKYLRESKERGISVQDCFKENPGETLYGLANYAAHLGIGCYFAYAAVELPELRELTIPMFFLWTRFTATNLGYNAADHAEKRTGWYMVGRHPSKPDLEAELIES
jgi:hypothetical protein